MIFVIPGKPQAQGSKRLVGKHMIESNGSLAPWRADAIAVMHDPSRKPVTAPVSVRVEFVYPRPRSHFGTGKNADVLKPSAPTYKTSAPDTDKLCRAVGDALEQAGVIRSDALIAAWTASKTYGRLPLTRLHVTELPASHPATSQDIA